MIAPGVGMASAMIIGLAATTAAAQSSTTDKVAAQALFDEARALAADRKWTDACPKLEESQRLDPRMVTLYRLADCYERIGRTASAWVLYRDAASLARDAGAKAREKVALEHAVALEPILTRMMIVVPETPGIQVSRDDVVIGRQQWGIKVSVDPGSHTVVATAPGKKPFRSVVKTAGSGSVVTVTVPALEADESTEAIVLGSPPPLPTSGPMMEFPPRSTVPSGSTSSLGVVGAVTFGLGAAVMTSGIVLLAANATQSDSCPFTKCGLPGALFWAGTIATVGGGVMWLAYMTSKPQSAVYVTFGPLGMGVRAAF
jgi:hypothetical protein